MFFSKIGEYKACGLFGFGHFSFVFVTALAIAVSLFFTKNKSRAQIEKSIKIIVITTWLFELFRIGYKLSCGDYMFLESYVPLFYCSIFLYAGLLSAFGKGKIKRAGDVTLMTGSLVGGIVFLIFPTTSLLDYPAFHFVSVHSFLYHGAMVYVGLLLLTNKYIELKKSDILLYAMLTAALCLTALIVNSIFDCNLMFISKGFPGSFGDALYLSTQKLYTPLAILVHLLLPYYVVYGINKKISA